MLPWVHMSHLPKRHLDRFSRFRTAHERDQQTDRLTDRLCKMLATVPQLNFL